MFTNNVCLYSCDLCIEDINVCNNVYDLHIECVINNDDTHIAYVFPETDTDQIQKQTYCKPTYLFEVSYSNDKWKLWLLY